MDFWRLAPFPFAALPVVASDAALDHFVAPFIACHDEAGKVAAAKAKPAKGNHYDDLQQHLGTERVLSMQKSTPCGEYKQRQRKGDRQAKPNSNGMWETVAHGIYRQNYLKMAGPERTRFARRGNLIEIKFSSPKLGIAVGA